jgi:hypothetical protein
MHSRGVLTAFPHSVQRCFLSTLVLSFCILPLQCATLERLSLDDLIAKSTSIVRGTVVGSYAAMRGPLIYTHYAIQVKENLKGSPQTIVDVAVPGGTAGQFQQIFAGAPQLPAGGDLVLFLWTGRSGLTQIMGLTQGLFSVSKDQSAATRPATSELMLDPVTAQPVKDQSLTLQMGDLRSRVAASAKGTAQ